MAVEADVLVVAAAVEEDGAAELEVDDVASPVVDAVD